MEGEAAAAELHAGGTTMALETAGAGSIANTGTPGRKRHRRELSELSTPVLERGSRERKSVERLIVSPDKAIKEFKIAKGAGTSLKDIPNVLFKLSKRRGADEVVQTLHKILFGKTAKASVVKANILQFSGYVWSADEEKEKAKVKERLERCIRESIFQISDLLDLKLSRSLKKEDFILKVFEFLESPHKTTDRLVEESAKGKRSKKGKKTPIKRKKASGQRPRKSPKSDAKASRKRKFDEGEDEDGGLAHDDEVMESEPDAKSDEDYGTLGSSKKRKRRSLKKQSNEPKKERRRPSKEVKREKKIRIKLRAKEPTDVDLQGAISEMLQDVDFSKVTFSDVLTQLGKKFSADLSHKKAYLKELIKVEVARLVNEAADEEGEENIEHEAEEAPEEHENPEDVSGGAVKAKEDGEDDEHGGDEGDNADTGEEEDARDDDEHGDGADEVIEGKGSKDSDGEGVHAGSADSEDEDGDGEDGDGDAEVAAGRDGDDDAEGVDVATQEDLKTGVEKGNDEKDCATGDAEAGAEET